MPTTQSYDAIIVGAGFAGLYMLHRLRRLGMRAQVYEAGSDVGGTWYWNRYPGARCDVESMQYSYSFDDALQQEWSWSERFASQPEILRYAGHVADRLDLRRDIQFDTRVTSAHFDAKRALWQVATDRGDRVTARFCVMATGCLSAARLPEIPGRDSFAGPTYHTGAWPHEGWISPAAASPSSAPAPPPSRRFRSSPGRRRMSRYSSARRISASLRAMPRWMRSTKTGGNPTMPRTAPRHGRCAPASSTG
ncbi:flavin-containing monooxygenase [Siccirubricoccus deserti]